MIVAVEMQRNGLSLGKFFTNGEGHRNDEAAPEEKEKKLEKIKWNKLHKTRRFISAKVIVRCTI